MSNNKILKISNIYMLLCGMGWWDRSLEINDVVNYRFLAKTTSPIISIASTYIVFLTKLQKRQTL